MTEKTAAPSGLLLALLSAAAFGTSGSFARPLTEAGWSPAAAVAVRIAVAAAILAIPAALAVRGRWEALRRNLTMVSAYGLTAVAGCQVFFFNAIQHLSVGVALLLEYLGVVLVVGWLWLRHGQRPRRLTIAGSVVAITGLVLMLDLTSANRLDVVGVLWGLGAGVGIAVYFVLSSKNDSDLPGVTMAGSGMAIGAVALFALGAAGALPMHATFGEVTVAGRHTSWIVPVIGLSLIAAAFAYVAGIGAARRLGAKLASFVGLTEVAFAVLFAWLLLDELPAGIQLAGGALIVTGVTLVRLDEVRSPAPIAAAVAAAEAKPLAVAQSSR